MDELTIVANVAIVFGVIYKLFELFVGRKERMMLIEKLPAEALADGKLKMGIYPLYLTVWEVDWFHLYLSVLVVYW